MTTVGIIGGSGLYALEGMDNVQEKSLDTPYGATSDVLVTGRLGEVELIFVPRHGRGHTLLPHEVPYRANVHAMKQLGADFLISVSAVGSMREELHPGHVVLPDQYIDRTRRHGATFFGKGVVAHVSMADPTCRVLAGLLQDASKELDLPCRGDGTYVCMEGPAFSTRGESHMYRSWGVDVIGMTALPEAKLAREAELHYATVALVTDYDCWRESEEAVTVEAVMSTLRANTEKVKKLLARVLPMISGGAFECGCEAALSTGLMTDLSTISAERMAQLEPILRKYIPRSFASPH